MKATAGGLAIVHCGPSLLVFDKPSGLPSVPGRPEALQDCLSARAQAAFGDARVVHRLDMATSGLIVLARGADAQRRLGIAFAQREVDKGYVAVVDGLVPLPGGDGWGEIDLPLAADWPRRPRQQVCASGRRSVTRYRVLGHDGAPCRTRLELQPITGRTHQLRVHLQAIGHPILGDALYAPAVVQAKAPRLLLHAHALTVPDPSSGERLRFDSPPPF